MSRQSEGMSLVKDLRRLADRLESFMTGHPESSNDRWARQLLSVLAEVDRRSGRVTQEEFLEIGAMYDYTSNGMGGFYQRLVEADGGETVLTDAGRARLVQLRKHHKEL